MYLLRRNYFHKNEVTLFGALLVLPLLICIGSFLIIKYLITKK